MPVPTAGLLMFREVAGGALEVLLVHPGGPYYWKKDDGCWSIPKGIVDEPQVDEAVLRATACRELTEETGLAPPPEEALVSLGSHKANNKIIHIWAFRGELPEGYVHTSNTFELEWPPRSGKMEEHPEVDRAEWFDLETARRKLSKNQLPFIDRLAAAVRG
ncbi:MAG: NUDIX domain-containing protein [Myxococcales bacterium]|nr:NUDIX domain-containing protein [Myxococcales bacterium]MCB9737294.1 NUDIX domain-containing protein [Deltaproteobacteria bacterium]